MWVIDQISISNGGFLERNRNVVLLDFHAKEKNDRFMELIIRPGTDVSAAPIGTIYVNPPESEDDDFERRMNALLKRLGKTPEEFQKEIVDQIVAFSQLYSDQITSVLISIQEEEVKVIFGIRRYVREFTDAVTDLDFLFVDTGWVASVMEFPLGHHLPQLIKFSHFE